MCLHIVLDFGGDSVKEINLPIVHSPQCRPDIRKISDLIRLYTRWHAPPFNDRSHQSIRGIADPLIPDDNITHGCICLGKSQPHVCPILLRSQKSS